MTQFKAIWFLGFLVVTIAVLPSEEVQAQDSGVKDLLQCDKIKKADDRLACFNTIVEKLKEDPDAFHEQRQKADGQKPDYTRTYRGEDAFGRSRKYFLDSTPSRITSNIKRYWKSGAGKYTFFLENGQIWQVKNAAYVLPTKPVSVTVKKGLVGSFRLTVKGQRVSGRSEAAKRID